MKLTGEITIDTRPPALPRQIRLRWASTTRKLSLTIGYDPRRYGWGHRRDRSLSGFPGERAGSIAFGIGILTYIEHPAPWEVEQAAGEAVLAYDRAMAQRRQEDTDAKIRASQRKAEIDQVRLMATASRVVAERRARAAREGWAGEFECEQ